MRGGLLARLYPWAVEPSDELRRAVAFLGWETPAGSLVRASYGAGMVGGGLTLACAALAPPAKRPLLTLATAVVTLLVVWGATAVPQLLATARRASALGDAPGLVGRAVLSMRLSPSPERAAVFAAQDGATPLGASLESHVHRVRATDDRALVTFGAAWRDWFPALERSLKLVTTAGELADDDRQKTLDRALSVVLDGTREQLRSFAERVRGPVTALYAFGILLPTALVALLPAGAAAGVGVSLPTVVFIYDLLLPAGLVAASAWLLAHRPATFPPPEVRQSHPDVPARAGIALALGGGVAVAGWLLAAVLLPAWAPPVAALGLGCGTGLLVQYRPYRAVHDDIRAVEAELTDALSLVGRRVSAGRAVEAAVAEAGSELTGPVGDVFAEAAATQRRLQVGIERAFLGDHGALASVPSQRARESVAFLSLAARYGQPAGPAILALADHVDELRRVETAATHSLQSVAGALRSTGAVFGPLVAGATVALADGMAGFGASGLPGESTPLPWLGLAVGWYVLVLCALLPTLATGLVRGLDRPLVGARVGRALVSGTLVYLVAYAVVGGLT